MTSDIERIRDKEWAKVPMGPLADIPAQLNPDEKQLLFYLLREYWRGDGLVVDGGAFLGGSAKCMALGLEANCQVSESRKLGLIHSYDLFVAGKWMPDRWFPEGRPIDGSSTRPIYDQNLSGLLRYITVHEGDIQQEKWVDGPIGILFLDICKLIAINDHCTKMFFPHLVPEQSILINQDYIYQSYNIWIYVTMELLSDHFSLLTACKFNSAAWLCVKPIEANDVARALVRPLSHEQRADLARSQAMRWTGEARRRIEASVEEYLDNVRRGNWVVR